MSLATALTALTNIEAAITTFTQATLPTMQARRAAAVALHGTLCAEQGTEPNDDAAREMERVIVVAQELAQAASQVVTELRRIQMLGRAIEAERVRLAARP